MAKTEDAGADVAFLEKRVTLLEAVIDSFSFTAIIDAYEKRVAALEAIIGTSHGKTTRK